MTLTKDDVSTIVLGLTVFGRFFLPTIVRWANRWRRNQEERELQRPGFPVMPAPPVQTPEREGGKAAE
jgi:hypothetical protein